MSEDDRAMASRVCAARDRTDARPVRVIASEQSAWSEDGTHLALLGIVTWTTWFEIPYQIWRPRGSDGVSVQWLHEWHSRFWHVVDDLNHLYGSVYGHGSGIEDGFSGVVQCAPELARHASTLRFDVPILGDGVWQHLRLEVALPDA